MGEQQQQLLMAIKTITTKLKHQDDLITELSEKIMRVEEILLDGGITIRPTQRHPTQETAPVLDCTPMLESMGLDTDSGRLLRNIYCGNDREEEDEDDEGPNIGAVDNIILSAAEHTLNSSCVGTWHTVERDSATPPLFLGGPTGVTEFRRVYVIPACVKLGIPFTTMQCVAEEEDDDEEELWIRELQYISDKPVAVFHLGYEQTDTLYVPFAEMLRLIGMGCSYVYPVAFPADIQRAAQCYSNEDRCQNLCGKTTCSPTSRNRALESMTFVHDIIVKYCSVFSSARQYADMGNMPSSFCEHLLPRYVHQSRSGEKIPPDVLLAWFTDVIGMPIPDTDLVYVLKLVFLNAIVVSCAGTNTDAQTAVFKDTISPDELEQFRTDICTLQIMARGWNASPEFKAHPNHIAQMRKLVDLVCI
tara:strand:- start:5005 stop:6258 length:1254 start_codon:yes stop_codon:yes gene_type:complete